MGCDIHAYVEIKVKGQWLLYNQPQIGRNYNLFSLMAGVRQHETSPTPISKPRGLPDDVSTGTQFEADRWGVDGHSHSWLSAAECRVATVWFDKTQRTIPTYLLPEKEEIILSQIYRDAEALALWRGALSHPYDDAYINPLKDKLQELGIDNPYPSPLFGYFFGNYIFSHLDYPHDVQHAREVGFEDVRLVFWFDN